MPPEDLLHTLDIIERARLHIAQSQHFPHMTAKASRLLADAQFLITQHIKKEIEP